jgi:hypothetical protein
MPPREVLMDYATIYLTERGRFTAPLLAPDHPLLLWAGQRPERRCRFGERLCVGIAERAADGI